VQVVGGSLWDIQSDRIVRNLTAMPYNVDIPAGQNQSLTYNFATELHPQDLRLFLAAIVIKGEAGYQIPAFNGTVSIVEAPLSIFDPQMYARIYNVYAELATNYGQDLPLPLPHRRICWYLLLHLQHLDRDTVPTEETWWKGRRTRKDIVQGHQEC
jgi:hypothetical protein